ncbi:MAG: sulfatase-like hydrolase/transferase, partial [Azovibrio sp.]
IQKKLLAPLENIQTDFFQKGTEPSPGVTLDGELRELCKLRTNSYNLSDVVNGFEECLPNRLKNQGYSTAAMHGASKLMYDRHHWYPRVGFQKTIFFEDKLFKTRCYSFPGACDLDLMEEVPLFFAQSGNRFFYWLTLNTHANYDPRDIRFNVFDCESFQIPSDTESCRNLKLQAQFFNGLAKMLQSKSMEGVEVIIVGDHVPVIMDLNEKKKYFSEDQVPWIHFKVKHSA